MNYDHYRHLLPDWLDVSYRSEKYWNKDLFIFPRMLFHSEFANWIQDFLFFTTQGTNLVSFTPQQ